MTTILISFPIPYSLLPIPYTCTRSSCYTLIMKPFWETKTLSEMTSKEWESLCDRCGKCCVYVLEYDETGDVYETDAACHLYDSEKRCCTDYKNRTKRAPDCVRLTAKIAATFSWLPPSCAYRRLSEGKPLPKWHPLITGDEKSVKRAGAAARPALIADEDVSIDFLQSRITKKRRRA